MRGIIEAMRHTIRLRFAFVSVMRIWNVLLILLTMSSILPVALDQPQAGDSTSQHPVPSNVVNVIRNLFGTRIGPADDRKPYYWTGDFNGDNITDLLVMVRLKGPTRALPKDIVVLSFWNASAQSNPSPQDSELALAIIHGSDAGWNTAPAGKYLIHSKDFFSSPLWESTSTKELISIVRIGSKKSRATGPPVAAKGDSISLATEAGIDTFVYWNGKTYRLFEPAETP
jgi:hypothetical protein